MKRINEEKQRVINGGTKNKASNQNYICINGSVINAPLIINQTIININFITINKTIKARSSKRGVRWYWGFGYR
ncbi:MAG: hypothetical protein ABRQ25_16670 [Clostridiaceae bacterium]